MTSTTTTFKRRQKLQRYSCSATPTTPLGGSGTRDRR
jgi:hypothetical protein